MCSSFMPLTYTLECANVLKPGKMTEGIATTNWLLYKTVHAHCVTAQLYKHNAQKSLGIQLGCDSMLLPLNMIFEQFSIDHLA